MITKSEFDEIRRRFEESIPDFNDFSAESALKRYEAWKYLWSFMVRENNFTDSLGDDDIDWQIGNWANDTNDLLYNANLYQELIELNKQILKITWLDDRTDLFHQNALREIADVYAEMGDMEKCVSLYRQYLEKDPLWGWGWRGFLMILEDHHDSRYKEVLEEIYQKVQEKLPFRDQEDLCNYLATAYEKLGDEGRTSYFKALEKKAQSGKDALMTFDEFLFTGTWPKKIYPNDPCPCGSGKKFKKCHGRKR